MQIFDSYVAAGQELPQRARERFYCALIEFLAYGSEPRLTGPASAVMTAIMPSLEQSRRSLVNGRKGGRPPRSKRNKEANPERNPDVNQGGNQEACAGRAEAEPADAKTPKPKDKDKDKEPITPKAPSDGDSADADVFAEFGAAALEVWNRETGQDVRCLSPAAWLGLRRIRDAGRTLEDVAKVVRRKSQEWSADERMARYLRPETVLGPKFEGYLNAPEKREEASDDFAAFDF